VERAAPVVRKSQRQYDAEADAKEALSAPVQPDEPTVRTEEALSAPVQADEPTVRTEEALSAPVQADEPTVRTEEG
jgi:hypothetical protein